MKRKLLAIFLLVLLVQVSCSFSASTAKLENARMSRDDAGTDLTSVFAPGDTFYCQVDLANAPDDTKVKAVWTAVQVEGADPNTHLDETELTAGSGTVTFKLENANPWPAGKYKVELFMNDKSAQTVEFEVQ